jgi:nitrogen fixation protein FixH
MTVPTHALTRHSDRKLTGRGVLVMIIAFFAVVAGVNAVMVRLAVSTFGGVETESAYKASLSFMNEVREADIQQARNFRVDGRLSTPRGDAAMLELTVRRADGTALTGLAVDASLHHPADRREDRSIAAREIAAGRYVAEFESRAGQWDLLIEIHDKGQRMFRSRSRVQVRQAS